MALDDHPAPAAKPPAASRVAIRSWLRRRGWLASQGRPGCSGPWAWVDPDRHLAPAAGIRGSSTIGLRLPRRGDAENAHSTMPFARPDRCSIMGRRLPGGDDWFTGLFQPWRRLRRQPKGRDWWRGGPSLRHLPWATSVRCRRRLPDRLLNLHSDGFRADGQRGDLKTAAPWPPKAAAAPRPVNLESRPCAFAEPVGWSPGQRHVDGAFAHVVAISSKPASGGWQLQWQDRAYGPLHRDKASVAVDGIRLDGGGIQRGRGAVLDPP